MPHWYSELFFFALVSFVPVAIFVHCGGFKRMARSHMLMLVGCSILAVATAVDFIAHVWAWDLFHAAYGHIALIMIGFLPGSALVGLGVIQWIRYTSDLTAEVARRKKAEATLRKLTKKLEQAAHEAAKANQDKTDFLANMSHELRTPLNAIIGFTELMHSELFGKLGAPEYKDYLDIVHDSGQQLLDVIGDLLDLNKINSGLMTLREENVALRDVLYQCAALMQDEAAKKSVTVQIDATSSVNMIADVRMMRQIILNLLGNAVRFTETGRAVSMAVTMSADHNIVLTVQDAGRGMTRADIERATMPFGYGDSLITRSYESAALGLSLVNTFVELHGGILTIDSQVNVGTTVTAKFPAHRVISEETMMLENQGELSDRSQDDQASVA